MERSIWGAIVFVFGLICMNSISILFLAGQPVIEPCPTEDSDNCIWNGGSNGEGRSFITIDGTTYYFTDSITWED